MSTDWDEYAEQWEKDPSTAAYADKVFETLNNMVSLSGLKVLDFGCGTGLLTQKLSPLVKEVVALDSSEMMIEQLDAKELPNVEPVVDALSRGLVAYHPAFRTQFDLIVASSVCGFLDDFQQGAEIIASLLDDGGLFVHWDWLAASSEDGMTEQKIKATLTKAGFSSVETKVGFTIETAMGEKTVVMGIGQK
ncbi:class I SAM-dependent methyltransferase [Vibrio sp. SCSIO 43136]|uniref:class I SAM-dependent DNA methyltransferase n=1 Tax=Vibrio sp. SCSIO 43136 TaxID=2819101 RepID=UPI0020757836|nr:class I SAM-dependent methyltransferase [Vibrio sp. SCSIO 43136]USD67903.1 class I SAM-dependent methyltransferase [Vibrio sp. SCSIO 43136]